MERNILSVLVDNTTGVLARIAGLFSRRGYNIKSLAVGETHDPSISRMTILVECDDKALDQMVRNLAKQISVHTVEVIEEPASTNRELLLLKVSTNTETRMQVIELANIFRARVIDVTAESMTLEITGEGEKAEAIIAMMSEFGILEMARTGTVALSRGARTIYDCIPNDEDETT
ncbi:acetolactate synthase small subunit [Oscillospiraceae bacterium OttesenSCG-928-G22]|nr:acetolactate synthase small subunit [Oscillospiraceae bacterium OttesenSCG-928-G22]